MKNVSIILSIWAILYPLGSVAPAWAHPEIEEQIRAVNVQLEKRPGDAALYLQRGELHRIHRDWANAEADYLKASELDPEMATVQYCLGRMKLESGHPEQARALLDGYLKKRPGDSSALAARGRALDRLGRHLAAADDFSQAIEHASETNLRPELYLERARALMAVGPEQIDRAIGGLDAGIERLGGPVSLQLYAIDLETEAGRYNGAIRRIDRIASESARQEPWLMRKGAVMEAAGRRAAALEVYRQALSAVEALPESRRHNRAVSRLEAEARAAIERLNGK